MRLLLLILPLLLTPATAAAPVILILGDSLSAAYGLPPQAGWPTLLQQRLQRQGWPQRIVNASQSGETSDGGRLRLPGLLQRHRPTLLILALGANDGLRGLPLSHLRANLEAMIEQARRHGAEVILMAPRLPPNYGPYADDFHRLYHDLGRQYSVPVVDFLAAFGAWREYFQADGLHPTAEAQPLILDALWPVLQNWLGHAPKPAPPTPHGTPADAPTGSSPAAGNG